MDILDTSVIRGLSKRDIGEAADNRMVVVSPFTVWEILCHLDECKKGETPEQAFARRKGHVRLLQSIRILDDPFAQHAAAIGAYKLVAPARFEDRAMAKSIIDRVVVASCLADLDNEVFTYPDGRTAGFKDVAARARAALCHEEQQHIGNVRTQWTRIQASSGVRSPAGLTDEDLWKWPSAMLCALKRSYKLNGIASEGLFNKVCGSMYAYYGYLLARLCTYSRDAVGRLAVPPNDCEDGYICMHLRLFDEDILVVGDGKTERAMRRALSLWDAKVPGLPARCRVLGMQDYRAQYIPQRHQNDGQQ